MRSAKKAPKRVARSGPAGRFGSVATGPEGKRSLRATLRHRMGRWSNGSVKRRDSEWGRTRLDPSLTKRKALRIDLEDPGRDGHHGRHGLRPMGHRPKVQVGGGWGTRSSTTRAATGAKPYSASARHRVRQVEEPPGELSRAGVRNDG